jgi:hypothetical protein
VGNAIDMERSVSALIYNVQIFITRCIDGILVEGDINFWLILLKNN